MSVSLTMQGIKTFPTPDANSSHRTEIANKLLINYFDNIHSGDPGRKWFIGVTSVDRGNNIENRHITTAEYHDLSGANTRKLKLKKWTESFENSQERRRNESAVEI